MRKFIVGSFICFSLSFLLPKSSEAACSYDAYGNIRCDGARYGQTDVYQRGNSSGEFFSTDGRGNIQQRCGIDYLGRYSCN